MSRAGSRTRPRSSRRDDLALDLGDFLLELAEDLCRVDGMDEDGDVEYFVEIDDRREPAVGQEARIRYDEKCARQFFAEVELFWPDLQGRRRDDVFELEDALLIDVLRQERDEGSSLASFFPSNFEKMDM